MTYCLGFERSWQLEGNAKSSQRARQLLREALSDPLYADWLDDAQLAVSEIVSNVVLHAHTDLVLTVRAEHERLCIEVRDDSSQLPIERIYDPEATTGRGMALVRQLTTEFGAELLPEGGKVVWFVIGRPLMDSRSWPLPSGLPATVTLATGVTEPAPNAVHVILAGVEPALLQRALEETDAIFREMSLYWAEHPPETLARLDLVLAETARAHTMVAIGHLDRTSDVASTDLKTLRFWVTPEQSKGFAAARRIFATAEELAAANRLLRRTSAKDTAALRDWGCLQVVNQVAGEVASSWTEQSHLGDLSVAIDQRVEGWDATAVSTSQRALVAANAMNRIVAISEPLAAALGWRVSDLVGRTLNAIVPDRLRRGHEEGHRRHLMTGESRILGRQVQLPMLCADGSELDCGLIVTREGTRVGHPVFVAAVTLPEADTTEIADPPYNNHVGYADLTRLTLGDVARMAGVIRGLSNGQDSLQSFADKTCRYLETQLRGENTDRQTVLVRFYSTMPFRDLLAKDQVYAQRNSTVELEADVTCMTLMATAGKKSAWNDRNASTGGRVIPLTDESQVAAYPLLELVLREAGLDVATLLSRQEHRRARAQRESYGHFHVPDPVDSPLIDSKAFIEEHGVRTVLGFGGGLPTGGSFAVVLFVDVEVTPDGARLFGTLALSTSLGAFARPGMPFFPDRPRTDGHRQALSACEHLAARDEVLTLLLEVHERLSMVATNAAVNTLERARFETQRYAALARALQASLIPPELPRVADLETGAFFRPSGDGSEIGGDFYDLFPTSDQRWGFVLGDVSGKGAQAAALTALARHTVRAAAYHSPDACQVLERLDDAVAAHDADGRHLTALFAFVSARPGELTIDLALGGHPQPLVLRADGQVESVGVEGSALGLFPHPVLTQTRIILRSGDTLLAFSDGITEARRDNEEYGEERLRALLGGFGDLHPHDIAASVGHASLEFQRDLPHDDLAVVVLRCI